MAAFSTHPPIRTGLVGFGMVSSVFHAPLISQSTRFSLTHVVERSSAKAQEKYPGIQRCTTLEELLASDVELVVVATPSASHFACARAALSAGKHVVCEKPFTVTYAEALDLEALAKQKGVILTVFHNRRWDADFLTLRRVLGSGSLGEVVEFESRYDRFRPQLKAGNVWRERDEAGSGVLYDLGSHLVDQAVELFGRPTAVSADLRRQRDAQSAVDYFDVDLRYADRPALKVSLKAGCVVRALGPRYVMHGLLGSFVKHGIDVQEEQLKAGLQPGSASWGVEPQEAWGILNVDALPASNSASGAQSAIGWQAVELPAGPVESNIGCYEAFYEGVAAAVRDGAPPPVSVASAALVILIIESASESARTGSLVSLPGPPALVV